MKKRKAYQALKATQAKQALLQKKEVMVGTRWRELEFVFELYPARVELGLVPMAPSPIGWVIPDTGFLSLFSKKCIKHFPRAKYWI